MAQYFVDNPNNVKEVDHIDSDRTNNIISNLRWVSSSQNQKNKGDKIDFLPDNCVEFRLYGKHIFDGYYIQQESKQIFEQIAEN